VSIRTLAAGLFLAIQITRPLLSEEIPVRHTEGVVRGFLALKSLDGKRIADGDLIQNANGDRVTSRLVFRFPDGSIHDETVVFTQRQRFRLVSDHLIQKGPTFPHPIESSIDAATGRVTVRYLNEPDKKPSDEKMELPADLSNGMMLTLLKNIRPDAPLTTVPMVISSPSPRLVKLVQLMVSPSGADSFSVGRAAHKATRFVVKVEIGGLVGFLAKLLGKVPPDTSVWILEGEAPAFVKSEGPLYAGGPVWRIELASPVWTRAAVATPAIPATPARPAP
jgi:hypothetical protein